MHKVGGNFCDRWCKTSATRAPGPAHAQRGTLSIGETVRAGWKGVDNEDPKYPVKITIHSDNMTSLLTFEHGHGDGPYACAHLHTHTHSVCECVSECVCVCVCVCVHKGICVVHTLRSLRMCHLNQYNLLFFPSAVLHL